jgi:transposase
MIVTKYINSDNMKGKLDILLSPSTKAGQPLLRSNLRKHQADVWIHIKGYGPMREFIVLKNRNPELTRLPQVGSISLDLVLRLGSTMPRKKKKSFKKKVCKI